MGDSRKGILCAGALLHRDDAELAAVADPAEAVCHVLGHTLLPGHDWTDAFLRQRFKDRRKWEAENLLEALAKDSGDVTAKFTDYTRKANRDLIERSFNGTSFLKNVTAMERFYMASYPESFKCSAVQ